MAHPFHRGRLPNPPVLSPTPHIVIVDDDPGIRSLLATYLGGFGYRCSAVADGEGMRRTLERDPADAVVLDLMLPGEDGLVLCRNLRANSQVPVIMLTARGQPVDRIIGLEMGADDYMAKPFDPRELLARIRSVLRRSAAPGPAAPAASASEPAALRFGPWCLDTRSRQVESADGRVISLGGSDYRLLRVLLRHANRPLGRDFLLDQVYGRERNPVDRAVDMAVSRLRQHLEDNPRQPSLILTVRNEGYLLAADVRIDA